MIEAITAMNFFDLAGQNLRVGRAITPPNCFESPPAAPTSLPTAAAIAAAAATAKIQAMDAVAATNGSSTISSPGIVYPYGSQPVMASTAPGLITGVTITPNAANPPLVIAPPALMTNLPLSIKNANTNSNSNGVVSNDSSISNNTADSSSLAEKPLINENGANTMSPGIIEMKPNDSGQEEVQTLQQQENVVIKGSNARQVLMHKLMRKNEVFHLY